MAEAIYTLVFIAVLGIFCTSAQSDWLRTGVYKKEFIDGIAGKCSLSTGNNVICGTKWITSNSDITYSKTEVALNAKRCHYYTKITTRKCYSADSRQLVCTKKMTSYHINQYCNKAWLNWEECDKMCNGGISTRIKLTKSRTSFAYEREFETRQCHTHACPQWSKWQPTHGANGECDLETCSRPWSRKCIYKGVASADICIKYFNTSSNNEDMTENNSTHEIRPCHPSECIRPTTTMEATTTAAISNSTLVTPAAREWSNEKSMTQVPDSYNAWMGIGMGSMVVMCILFLACFAALKIGTYQSDEHSFSLKFKRTFVRKRRNANVELSSNSRNQNTATNEGDEYLQPSIRDFSHPVPPVPPPPLENGTFSSIDGTYCVVPFKDQSGIDTGGNVASRVDDNVDQSGNAIYSDIPAYQRQESATGNAASLPTEVQEYSTSEFDSCTDEELDHTAAPFNHQSPRKHRKNPSMSIKEDEDSRSFDSDERRDIVETLRKKSKMSKDYKRPNSFEEDSDIGSEEDNISTHDITRSNSSRSTAYAKLHRHHKHGNPQLFRTPASDWANERSELRLGSEEISHLSPHNQEALLPFNPRNGCYIGDRTSRNSSTENSRHQLLARCSSGGSSISSYFDPATSDYHSAVGDSLDGDRDFRARIFPERTPSLLSRLSYDRPPMKLPTSSGYFRTPGETKKKSSSLINPKISNQTELNRSRASSIPTNCRYGREWHSSAHGIRNYPFPRSSSSSNEIEISADKKLSTSSILTSDEYNDPIDARTPSVKDITYSTYKLPINALTTGEDENLV